MRKFVIEQMHNHLAPHGYDSGNRFRPVRERLYFYITGDRPDTKRGRKEVGSINLRTIEKYCEGLNDAELLDVLCLIVRRYAIQM